MSVNVTADVIFACLFTGAQFYALWVSGNQLRKGFHYRFYQLAVPEFIFNASAGICYALANLFLSVELCIAAIIFAVIGSLPTLLKVDTLKREQGDPVKLTIIIILITLTVVAAFAIPSAAFRHTYPLGVEGISVNPLVGAGMIGALTLAFVYYFHATYLVSKQAPLALKRIARVFALGVFIIVVGLVAFAVLQPFLPGFPFFVMGVGAIIDVYAYGHEPKIIFILPFTALRLTVMDTKAGIPLFTHTWNKQGDLAEADLFSGMLQGVNIIVRESLKRGNLQEIRVEGAIIIAYRIPEYPVACMLVATRPTQSLRDGLKHFAEQFCAEFQAYFVAPTDELQFSGAAKLVAACFPHVPTYV